MNLKRYNVTVNGTAYDVTVQETDETESYTDTGAAPAPAPSPAKTKPSAKSAPVSSGTAGKIQIEAPMPGLIVEVKVKVGDSLKNGETVAVLEAMKLENDVVATADGVVASVNVAKGDNVSAGAVIVTLN
jgi:biotin carboxyl carrier protein